MNHLLDIHFDRNLQSPAFNSPTLCQPCFAHACTRVQNPSYLHSLIVHLFTMSSTFYE